jgi:hypothetical protein
MEAGGADGGGGGKPDEGTGVVQSQKSKDFSFFCN